MSEPQSQLLYMCLEEEPQKKESMEKAWISRRKEQGAYPDLVHECCGLPSCHATAMATEAATLVASTKIVRFNWTVGQKKWTCSFLATKLGGARDDLEMAEGPATLCDATSDPSLATVGTWNRNVIATESHSVAAAFSPPYICRIPRGGSRNSLILGQNSSKGGGGG